MRFMTSTRSNRDHNDAGYAGVEVRRVEVPLSGVPSHVAGLRIAHVSDLHFRHWNRLFQATLDLLLQLDYDVLFVTGDLGTRRRRWQTAALIAGRFFEPLAKRGPIYAVAGNHDDPRLITAGEIPVQFLSNETRVFRCRQTVIELIGLDQSNPRAEKIDTAFSVARSGDLTILLAHYPSTVYRLPSARVHLQLSGHTHGGQIRLPWLGCVWPNDRISRHMARGLHRIAGTYLHVSPGIGVSPPIPMRINCPPEITILEPVPTGMSRTSAIVADACCANETRIQV